MSEAVVQCSGCGRCLRLELAGPFDVRDQRPIVRAALLAIAVGLDWGGCASDAPAGAEPLCPDCRAPVTEALRGYRAAAPT